MNEKHPNGNNKGTEQLTEHLKAIRGPVDAVLVADVAVVQSFIGTVDIVDQECVIGKELEEGKDMWGDWQDPLLFFFTVVVLIFEAFALPAGPVPVLQASPEAPVLLPPEPLSRIVFVNDLPAGQTVTFNFFRGATVYVANSADEEAQLYESNIHITGPDVDGLTPQSMTEAGKRVDEETGFKRPVFAPLYYKFSVTNRNTEQQKFKNPGILYFLLPTDGSHLSKVYETASAHRNVYVKADHIENQYVTLLNPTGAVKISNIRHIDGLTALSVSAGGLEETNDANYTIHNIGKDDALSSAPLFIVEPVFTATAVSIPTDQVLVPMNWSDWSVGMSPGFMLSNETTSFKYVFNASLENSQFDVQMFGELDASSSLSLSYDGYDGIGTEIFSKRHLEWFAKNTKGQILTVEYKRGDQDRTRGVLVRVHCSQPAALPFVYTVFSAVAIRYLFL